MGCSPWSHGLDDALAGSVGHHDHAHKRPAALILHLGQQVVHDVDVVGERSLDPEQVDKDRGLRGGRVCTYMRVRAGFRLSGRRALDPEQVDKDGGLRGGRVCTYIRVRAGFRLQGCRQ